MINLSESSALLIFVYLAELILGLILFSIFRYFGKLYRRRFLYTWSLSWLAFSVYILTRAILILFDLPGQSIFCMFFRAGIQLFCFLQITMILRGTYEMIHERAFHKRRFKVILWILFFIAVASGIALDFVNTSDRYLLHIGSRTFTTGLGFLVTGIVAWTNKKFSRGFGQRLLTASFVIYSLYQLYIFLSAVVLSAGNIQSSDFYGGIADLLLVAMMGMGMIMWLLEDERVKLEKANKELDHFLYSTSHDLRAPIASILGLTYLGKIEFEEERARTFMGMIEERIKKLDLIIGDILSLSRSKKLDLKIERLNLKELLDDTIADIKFNKGASAITLNYTAEPSHVFKSDYNQMKIILGNLLGNAVKYHNLNQANPFIQVQFSRGKEGVQIAIEDNGQGIRAESLPQIFEMFYRASPNTEGTGLGLYIVKEALNKIKGRINVESEFGKGSRFTIILERG